MNERIPLRKYQARDVEVVDYRYAVLERCSFAIRGPLNWSTDARNIVCLGSAATFGRFAEKPFSFQIAEQLGANVVNLGFGGARFETYLKEPATLELCRKSDLVILELMSARSYPSPLFRPLNHLTGKGRLRNKYARSIKSTNAGSKLLGRHVFVDDAHKWAAKTLDWAQLTRVRQKILAAYREDGIRLIREIGRPVLLLWFSQRPIDQVPEPGSHSSWDCGFPHFVDRETIETLRPHAIGFVEVVSKLGSPSRLISKSTGEPVNITGGPMPYLNNYYPSPEMHGEAASKLCEFLKAYWPDAIRRLQSDRNQPAR